MRATGLQGDTSPEIIEILDDDTSAFGNRAPSLTVHDTGGPRWIGPVAGAALVALIGYGIATMASSTGLKKTAPVTSTSVSPVATVPATTTTIPAPPVPYYAADPPREFTVQYADIQPQADGSYFSPGKFELWATEGASAGSGSWFSVNTYPGGGPSIYATDAYRFATEHQSIAISHTSAGQSIAQFTPGGLTAMTLTTFGWSDEDLVRLAESTVVEQDNIRFVDPALIADYRMLSSIEPYFAIQGQPLEQVFYASRNNANGGLSIVVAQRPRASEGDGTLHREVALRFFLDHNTPFVVDGHSAVAGVVVGQPDYAMANWIAGDHTVTVSGAMPLPQLITIARTVHQVSPDEWEGMKFQATRHNDDSNFGDYDETPPLPVSFGTDANADEWTITVVVATFSELQQINWQWSGNGFGSQVDGNAKINTVVDERRTYVLADLPRAVAATAELQIARTGLDPILVRFNDIDPNLDRTFAAYAFSEPVQYTAQIVGADGTVLASWPSP